MAVKGYIDSKINALPEDLRGPIGDAFHYLLDNWRVGTGIRAENAQWYRVSSTSAATANTEFSVVHGLGSVPGQLLQVLDLSQVNSQIVALKVTRAADASRLYLSSPSTSAVMTLLVEP